MDELEQVLHLWRAAGAEPTVTDDIAGLRALMEFSRESLLVALDGSAVVGTLIWGWDGWRGSFFRLAVDRSLQRRGIATALVHEGERRLLQVGARRVAAVAVESADCAVPFWTAAGYAAQGDRVRLVKNLG
jgi:ribosomal protein S18 acetylase RimI-like enzyme